MDSQKIRTALGRLQADPESSDDWAALREAIDEPEGDLGVDEAVALLQAARNPHRERGEWRAVAALYELEVRLTELPAGKAALLAELARVLGERLFDSDAADAVYKRVQKIEPENTEAKTALKESADKRERYLELSKSYAEEADQAPDEVYKSSMLMRAAEMSVRFGGEAGLDRAIEQLEQAVRLDPSNERAGLLLELVYANQERWEEQARVLERLADRGSDTGRVSAGVRLARIYKSRLMDQERAARAYDRVLREQPDHTEAMSFLSEFYLSEERWDELVALYEGVLKTKDTSSRDQVGDMLQIAMLHWKKRGKLADAEPWFERIRRYEPAHDGMLDFYREYTQELDDNARLIEVLQGAQRAIRDDSKKRTQLANEIAKLAEGQKNAQKAIEQYKSVLRQDPDNEEAREALKRLYKQTQGHNALVELLRQQLERIPVENYAPRVEVLREVATVYRQYIKSDTALVSVLNQIVQLDDKLDEQDILEVRELVGLYEKLGRWRDLLTNQRRLAELTSDVEEKKNLYRAVARRWLEQFSNVQNATEAYAELFKLAPDDAEARDRLVDLYQKRRAWPALYELYAGELETAEGPTRLSLMKEMARLAAERLNRGAEAVALYRRILEADPGRLEVIDALEKHAERSKDWETLAEALELRVEQLDDQAAKLSVLQKLGTVYADQIRDSGRAARAWGRVLELSPGHNRALRVLRDAFLRDGDYDGLEQMYASQNDWEGLAEVLSNSADRATDPETKVDLSYRAAHVYEQQLGAPDRAFRCYERVLAADPNDGRAVRALVPLYEQDEKWSRLPALYEVLLEQAPDSDKMGLLEKLVEVTGKKLSDRRAAAEYAERAYKFQPTNEAALAMFEEASRQANRWEAFVDVLEKRLAGVTADAKAIKAAGVEPRQLRMKLAEIYAHELGKGDEAIAAYKAILQEDPEDEEAIDALDALLRRGDRRDELRWLLELRTQHARGDEERVRILTEWATLEEDVFESQKEAADLHRRILEVMPDNEHSLRVLARLLLGLNDVRGAVSVIESHRDQLAGEARGELEADLAELYLVRLEQPEQALKAAEAALEDEAARARVMAILERLVQVDAVKARAAEVLATQYAEGGEARREAHALEVLLEQTHDEAERLDLFVRLAGVHEEKLEAYGSALDVLLKAVSEFPSELSLWERADTLSALAGRPTDLADAYRETLRRDLAEEIEVDLCDRAARLHEDKLGDPMGATPYLERVLSLRPGNELAFSHLKDILTAAERWAELEALYDKASQATEDPQRRIDMLIEVALICEEIIEDPKKATRYYERILEVDPLHDNSIRALDRLYAMQGRNEDLAGLLERRVQVAVGDELNELKLRLAQIQLDLLQPDKAVDHVDDVLQERPNDYEARELAERMLEIGSLRIRAARMLERVYEVRDEIRDLVRVLTIRLEALDQEPSEETEDERRELLRRIAVLRDDRLHDDQGAFDALTRLVPLDPLDLESRQRVLEVGTRLGAYESLADVLLRTAKRADTPGMQGEILMQVGRIQEDHLGQRDEAEKTYQRVLNLDENDADLVLPAARALEAIYSSSDQNQKLAEMLRVQVRLEADSEERAQLLARLGDLCENVLSDPPAAIEAWKSRLEELPSDESTMSALDRLYEQTENWQELVTILERRRDLTTDSRMRRTLLERGAKVLADKLGKTSDAIDTYQTLVEEFGPSIGALQALQALYRTAKRWDELVEVYERHLDVVDTDSEQLRLLAELGDLRREHIGDVEGALEVYRRALSIDSSHAASRAALEELLQAEDPAARSEAAEILHPIWEREGNFPKLLMVLEIEIGSAEDPLRRLDSLDRALTVAEHDVGDKERAFGYAERALREAIGHTDLRPYLEHLDRLAAATSRQADHVKLLRAIVPDIFDGDVQLAVTLKIAQLSRQELKDNELSKEYYQKALEFRADDAAALLALQSLYEELGDSQNLLDVLERRADLADEDERKQLLFRRARLLAHEVKDARAAIAAYEAILDMELDADAVKELESLYLEEQLWVELIALYQRQLDEGAPNASDLHVRIARVLAEHQGDLMRAFEELEHALQMDPQNAAAIAELQSLLENAADTEFRARAAALLEPVYLARGDYTKVMAALKARLQFSQDPGERRELLHRLAQLHEEQEEDYLAALETTAELLSEDLGDQSVLSELERLARVAGAEKRLADIYEKELLELPADDEASARLCRRTGELFVELGELERGLTAYRRALAFEPESQELFEAVDSILERMKRPTERVDLYRDALDHRYEDAERLKLLHTIARLQREELGQPDAAIETYRAALEVDESDKTALTSLTELYRELSRHDDLAQLFLRRAESAPTAEAAAGFRLALARLYKGELSQTDLAIEQLEEIVRATPGHEQAVEELEALKADPEHRERIVEILRPLYETADDWRHLIVLNQDRLELAQDPVDKVRVLRETAELWETRGRDVNRARRAMSLALKLDPDDGEVRTEYERLSEATDAWDELSQAYEEILTEKPDLLSRRDYLSVLAKVHNERRDDPRKALHAYRRLHQEDESDLEPLGMMERLATLLSDWQTLVEVLTAQANLVLGDEEQAGLWRRIGEAKRDMLDDPVGALSAYERALELEPDNAACVDKLIELVEQKHDPNTLVDLYQRRVELSDDEEVDLKYHLLCNAAKCYEDPIGDFGRAIDAYNQALSIKPGDPEVMAALNRLYRKEEMWPELLDNLRLEAQSAASSEQRAQLRREIGHVLSDKLQSYEEALDEYRLVLEESPDDADAILAAQRIAEDHEDLRFRVADLLVEVLQNTQRHEELVKVLELRLTVEGTPGERADTLRSIAEVLETRLSRTKDAQEALLRALEEVPEAEDVHENVGRLSEECDGWERYAEVLSERAQSTFDPDVGRDLLTRLGEIAQQRLHDDRRAVEAYARAVEVAGDQPDLLEALDELYQKLKEAQPLSEILERRVVLEDSDERRAELYYRLALLQIRDFEEPPRGLASLRLALEQFPEHDAAAEELEKLTNVRELFEEAAEILENVYRTRGRTDKLAELYEKRVGFAETPGERIEMRRNLARVLEDDCQDPAAAQRVLQQGLQDDLEDSILFDELERLASETGNWEGAAAALHDALSRASHSMPEVTGQLWLRLASWYREHVGDRDAAEKALTLALQAEPENDEVLVLLEQLQEEQGRELELIETLRRRAKLQLDDEAREELYRRAKQLADSLGNQQLAEAVLREVLEYDDTNRWALSDLTELRKEKGDYEETYSLLVKRSELAADGELVRQLRQEAALLARDQLGDGPRAIDLFVQLFEDHPTDSDVSGALRGLYEAENRFEDLARLLERLIEMAESVEERSRLRLELARLNQEKFEALDSAVELLTAILDDDEGNAEAVVALSELYEQTHRDAELADLLSRQIEAAKDRGDGEAELRFQVRLGEICDSRLGDRARAIETYQAVLDREPEHRGALEALARLHQSAEEHAEAASVIERLLALNEGEEAVRLALVLAEEYEKLDDHHGVARALERGLSIDATNADLNARLKEAYRNNGEWEKLAEHLANEAEAAADAADKVALYREAAQIHAEKRADHSAAADLLERASQVMPDDRDLLLQLCDAYNACGRGKSAAEALERIVESYGGKRSKELAGIHRRLADAYLAEGDAQRALQELDKAFRIEPGNVLVLKKLGEVAIDTGDAKKAQQMYRALLLQKLGEDSPITKAEVFFRLGQVHEQLGEKSKAIQMLDRAIQTDGAFGEAKTLLEKLRAT